MYQLTLWINECVSYEYVCVPKVTDRNMGRQCLAEKKNLSHKSFKSSNIYLHYNENVPQIINTSTELVN
jgi:hypothetical protein